MANRKKSKEPIAEEIVGDNEESAEETTENVTPETPSKYGFKIKFKNGVAFKKIVDVIASIVYEATIEVNPMGLSVHGIDTVRVCGFGYQAPSVSFAQFTTVDGVLISEIPGYYARTDVTFGDLVKITKGIKQNEDITLIYDPYADSQVIMTKSKPDSKKTMKYSLKTLGNPINSMVDANFFDRMYKSCVFFKFKVQNEYLVEAVKEGRIYEPDWIKIWSDTDTLTFSTTAVLGEFEYVLEREEFTVEVVKDVSAECGGCYSNNKFDAFIKMAEFPSFIGLGIDMPFYCEFTLPDQSVFKLIMAPRIDENTGIKVEGQAEESAPNIDPLAEDDYEELGDNTEIADARDIIDDPDDPDDSESNEE